MLFAASDQLSPNNHLEGRWELKKNQKRIFIFLFIPILIAIPFFTEDFILRIISGVILLIYAGFIIFLRDSMRSELLDQTIQPNLIEYEEKDKKDFLKPMRVKILK